MMSLMDHSPAARGRVMVRRSICLMSESNSGLAETIAAMTSAFDVGSGIVSLGEPRMARSAHLVADFSGSPAKCGGTGVPSAEVVEIQEKRPHGLERLEGLLQKVGRQHLLVQKGSGDRDLFEPQQLDLWVVPRRIALKGPGFLSMALRHLPMCSASGSCNPPASIERSPGSMCT